MSEPRNPFIYGVPVPPSKFVGRKREVRTIFDQIASPALGSVAINGEHCIGRTSLLHYVVDPDIAEGWRITSDRYILAYLDCQSISGFTPTRFWRRVLGLLPRWAGDAGPREAIERLLSQEEIACSDLDAVLDGIHESGHKFILLLDEFEWAVRTDTEEDLATTRDFLSGLRALIGRVPRALSLIVAIREPLEMLCRPIKFIGSPFHTIFVSLSLKPFTREEAEELIDKYLKGTGVEFSEEDRPFVYDVSRGHPYWLQNACFKLFAGKPGGKGLYEEIAQALRDEGLSVGPGPARELWVDVESGNVWVEGRLIEPPLTDAEYRLLKLLFRNANKICDKYEIVESVWGEEYLEEVEDFRIAKLLSRLRQRIEPDPSNPRFIQTVRGRGYKLVAGT